MFTGIIEALGTVSEITHEGENLHVSVLAPFTNELQIDQSVSHNGICLTVTHIEETVYKVTAIRETVDKTAISEWKKGSKVNLERGMKLGDRLDGHIVQGHVDQIGTCVAIREAGGSWYYTFSYDPSAGNLTIEKGSITVNGVSLTVVDSKASKFSVAIIPYTYEHTTFNQITVGTNVNLEFDVIGKYVAKLNAIRA